MRQLGSPKYARVGYRRQPQFRTRQRRQSGRCSYELDARLEIDVDAAEAAFRKATAVLNQEKKNAKRMEILAPSGAAAQSQLDIAIANVGQAEADVAARKADIARAKLHLEYASIRAPISGRIGRALVTEGAGRSEHADACCHHSAARSDGGLHVIGRRTNELRREFDTGVAKGHYRVGATHSRRRSTLSARGKAVALRLHRRPEPVVTLRGDLPTELTLLPGMYVRVQIVQGIDPDALRCRNRPFAATVPEAVKYFWCARQPRKPRTDLLRPRHRRPLAHSRRREAGRRVIVDGFQKFSDGDVVNPKLWRRPGNRINLRTADAAWKSSPK